MSIQDKINLAKTDKDLIVEALEMSRHIEWRPWDHKRRIQRMIAALNSGGVVVDATGGCHALPKDNL